MEEEPERALALGSRRGLGGHGDEAMRGPECHTQSLDLMGKEIGGLDPGGTSLTVTLGPAVPIHKRGDSGVFLEGWCGMKCPGSPGWARMDGVPRPGQDVCGDGTL